MKRKYVIYDQTFISLLFLSANVLVYRFVIVLVFRATFLSPLVTLEIKPCGLVSRIRDVEAF